MAIKRSSKGNGTPSHTPVASAPLRRVVARRMKRSNGWIARMLRTTRFPYRIKFTTEFDKLRSDSRYRRF
jgi:hypothetical protein